MVKVTHLPSRGVIEITGEDRVSFLQGLVSNDVTQAAPGRAVWAALLTPQGKWLADFFILSDGARLLLDAEALQVAMIIQRLGRFRLRAKAALRDASAELSVFTAWGGVPDIPADAVAAPDPRLAAAGWRVLAPAMAANSAPEDWDRHRLGLGLPDGSADLEAEKSVLLEAGFDELNGVSWSKGCYMGQELTARTKYRGLIKRRLVSVAIDGAAPEAGTPVMLGGAEVGTLRSTRDGAGLATLRLEAINAPTLDCGTARLRPVMAGWMKLPGSA